MMGWPPGLISRAWSPKEPIKKEMWYCQSRSRRWDGKQVVPCIVYCRVTKELSSLLLKMPLAGILGTSLYKHLNYGRKQVHVYNRHRKQLPYHPIAKWKKTPRR